MNIIQQLSQKSLWEQFYDHRAAQGNISEREAKDMCSFIANEEYLPVVRTIEQSKAFPAPRKKLIGKAGVKKKRVVYTFDRAENYVLKLIAFLLREYDFLFAPNLYSFRKNKGVRHAIDDLTAFGSLSRYYVYKVDISDYFSSVDTDILIPELEQVLCEDTQLLCFIRSLLENPFVIQGSEAVRERKGIMAGVPVSGFLANLYLRQMDFYFYENGIPYMRYSDDIIVFASTEEELREYIRIIKDTLARRRLQVNRTKEVITRPGERWSFLGFSFMGKEIDICPVSFGKLKAKMRRKSRALARWAARKGVSGTAAAGVFVRRFNAKLYDNPIHSELTWTRWFFPVINTDRTLREIDSYMQDCIRYLATGSRTKSRYSFRYEDIKALGYRSLVNEYHKQKKQE